jgi:hypothetical protein
MTCTGDQAADISTGAAHVFVRSGNTWSQQAFIKPHNIRENDWFASRLVLSGDGNTAAIPSPLTDGLDGKALEAGAVYLFTRTGTTWRQSAYVQGSNTEAYDQFGGSVGLSRDGRTLVATALGEDGTARGVNGNEKDNGADEAGAAYVFQVTPGT